MLDAPLAWLIDKLLRPHPVRALLQEARQLLPEPPAPDELLPDSVRTYRGALASYGEFLDQQEWELTLDDLAELGAALAPVPPRFWKLLEAVASQTGPSGPEAYWRQWQPGRAE
jgi:hypothetical protein